MAWSPRGPSSLAISVSCVARPVLWQPHVKFGSGTRAVYPQIAPVIEQRLPRKRQPQPHAVFLPESYEWLEQPRAHFRLYARTGILHHDFDERVPHQDLNVNGPAAGHHFDRVLEQIREHAFHALPLHGALD